MSAPQATYDLHLHTYWSYDACTPVDYYFRRARELGLRRIAIAEHFTMDSLPEILAVAPQYPDVRFVPAAEMTVRTPHGYSLDFVCLGLPVPIPPAIAAIFARYRQWQRATGTALGEGLRALGFEYGDEVRLGLLRRYRPERVIAAQGVTHVQGSVVQRRYFLEKGFAADAAGCAALLQCAAEKTPRPPYPDAADVLPVLRQAGAVVVVAHPSLVFTKDEVRRLDELREAVGFDGVECAHDAIPPALTPVYRRYCLERGLVSTGGSDCHADPANNPLGIATQHEFARHRGENAWLDELDERLPPAATPVEPQERTEGTRPEQFGRGRVGTRRVTP